MSSLGICRGSAERPVMEPDVEGSGQENLSVLEAGQAGHELEDIADAWVLVESNVCLKLSSDSIVRTGNGSVQRTVGLVQKGDVKVNAERASDPTAESGSLEHRDTKSRILDAAEHLFAQNGLAATSLRSIIAHAEVNLASVHYHFGSKRELVRAVFARRIEPVNRLRLDGLDRLEARGDSRPPLVEEIIRAFVGPPVRWTGVQGDREVMMRLMGRLFNEPSEMPPQLLAELFSEVRNRFVDALARALPDLDLEDIHWRFHFMVGTMIHTMTFADQLSKVAHDHSCGPIDPDQLLDRLTPYLTAGFSARPTYTGGTGGQKEA